MPLLGGLATTLDMGDLNSEIKRLGDNLSDLATAQQVSVIEAKIPSTKDLQEGLATSSEVKSLERAVSNIQPPSLEAISEDLVTGEQFSERIGELKTSLEPLAEIRQDMVTQHQLDADFTEVRNRSRADRRDQREHGHSGPARREARRSEHRSRTTAGQGCRASAQI